MTDQVKMWPSCISLIRKTWHGCLKANEVSIPKEQSICLTHISPKQHAHTYSCLPFPNPRDTTVYEFTASKFILTVIHLILMYKTHRNAHFAITVQIISPKEAAKCNDNIHTYTEDVPEK